MSIKACGIILYTNIKQKKFLLIQHHAGHWGFPKGHQEKGEDDLTTARRELQEETGIKQIKIYETFNKRTL